jgi:hypothetical protein
MFKMLPIFLGVAIIGGCVGIFFLREKRKSRAHSNPGPQDSSPIRALTEKPMPLHTGTFKKDKTAPNRGDLEEIKKFMAVT